MQRSSPSAWKHSYAVRIYYEDTDFSGLVYHTNYIKYCERARSEWLRALGIRHGRVGGHFAVRHIICDFLRPARYDDMLTVETALSSWSGARVILEQVISRGDERLFTALITVVLIDAKGRPSRMPSELIALLQQKAPPESGLKSDSR